MPAASAGPASCTNPVVCENALPGTPQTVWDIGQGDGTTIEGFADPFSANIGQSINFKIRSPAASYTIDIYRMGYYGGDGARLITNITPNISVSQNQPACNTNTATGLTDCGNWGVSATWNIPATVVSGVYFAKLSRTDGSSDVNQIPFVVTNNASHSGIVFMTSDETWQAYNSWGGNNLYSGNATNTDNSPLNPGRAQQVSYNRPFNTRFTTAGGEDFFFATEYPMIRFLEKNGYDTSYVSQTDVAATGAASMLEQHKVFMNVGHSEYWDAGDRANVTAARNAGVSLAFFAGNLMWWKTRWAPSQYGNEANRTLISYKESLDTGAQTDPADPPTWTGEWRDPRYSPPGDGGQPENALTGQLWFVNCCSYALQVPSAYAKLRFWRNTSVAALQPGQPPATMPAETLGYEWDSDVDNGFRPAGEFDMSKTTQTVDQLLLDAQEDIAPGQATNSLTLYKAASGALVFDTGSVQWSWGLDSDHDGDSQNPPSPAMQQATVNLLADMGTQPATLESDLVAATASADTTPPTSAVTSPSAGATFANGGTTTIGGTATDSGGVVAGVEVSTDSGSTWHPVTTMSTAATSVTWSYTWSVAGTGTVTILTRAADDSGNIETPGPGVSVTVNCPCGLFGNNYTPSLTSANDSTPYELGVKFQSTVPGWVAGVRFYKGAGNTGTHTGSLWTAGGSLLATGTFTNETASGWQTLTFAEPVQISANTTYVVSYYDPAGHYADVADLFDFARNAPPLTALKGSYAPGGIVNGVFNAGGPGFPTGSYRSSSYAVDVIFDTTQPKGAPPAVTSVTPPPGSTYNSLSVAPTATFSKAVVPSTVSFTLKDPGGNTVPGTVALNSADTVATFTPANSLAGATTYTATISGARDSFGQAVSPYTYSFTTGNASTGPCPCTIWPAVMPPGATDAADTSPVELGVTFQATSDGTISGIRFWKEPDNTGAHTGSLWTSTGIRLATGTFTTESTQGWQELDFTTPVAVTAGTSYVASYHTNTGHYADTPGGLASAVYDGPLTALANGGVYAYSGGNTFPSNSFGGANYWVDVVYTPTPPDTVAPTVKATSPLNGQTSVPTNTGVSFTFDKAVQAATINFTLTGPGGTSVPGSLSYDSPTKTATFTPTGGSGPLSPGTTYTATVSGAQNTNGVAMSSPYVWTFTTGEATPPPGQCPCSIWPDVTPTGASDAPDTSSVELGLTFKATADGTITGVRFYKEADNTGSHTGSLWSSTGALLATGTFTAGSTQGWQELDFTTPVTVTAGTTYVASYHTSTGHYADTPGGLASAVANGPLTALANGGVYTYSAASTFPSNSYNGSNYWVDVVYAPAPPQPAPAVQATNPLNGQTSVPTNTGVSFTFDKAVQAATINFTLTGPGGVSVPGSLSYTSSTDTATFIPTGALMGGSGPLSPGTAYTATVSGAQNTSGTPMSSPYTWAFTTAQATPPAGQCPCSIWPDSTQPSVASANDPGPINLGVKFKSDNSGWVTGIRFYKGAGNTGVHVGSLWDTSGHLLGQVTFSNESTAGWEQANFATAIPVTAGATYIASYFAPNGGYAYDAAAFANAGVDNAPLHALASSASGGNGVYLYSTSPAFPTGAYNATNYWVDVVFTTTAP